MADHDSTAVANALGASHQVLAEPINDLDHALQAVLVEACGGFSPISLGRAWLDWGVHMAVSPGRRMELASQALAEGARALSLATSKGHAGRAADDKRFRDEAWRQWPFSHYAESFLGWERWWDEATQRLHGADPHSLALVAFLGRQALDAVAPTNFLPTNPVALARTREEWGANLTRGAQYLWRDIVRARNGQRPEAALAWAPGKTVALSEGVVVKRTSLAEIIQYAPTTGSVRPEPVVIVPAWIMKYYILDLRPENSLIHALTNAGFTVFAISWRNPTGEDRDLGFDDYGADVMAALSAALDVTGAAKAHLVGYCIGGALAAVRAAAMARDLDNRLASLTMLAAQVDYTESGELKLFIDHSQIAAIEDVMWEEGTFEGSRMAGAFDLLRSNDLIWSRLVHQYLMGETEPMSDLAAWSSDTTRMPYRMHRDYLRDFYLNNEFAEGRYKVEGHAVSPHDIRTPVFALGTEGDNVAPWPSVFKIHQFADADVTFALTNGGHNQGVVSPPGTPHRRYRLATTLHAEPRPEPQAWFAAARPREGSWWPAWFDWLKDHSGAPVAAPPLGRPESGLSAQDKAPGRYVFG